MMLPIPPDSGALEVLTGQPELFTELHAPTVQAARKYVVNGHTTSRHAKDAARIIAAAALGWSVRRMARELGHGRDTVTAVLRIAEQAGKLRPVKERVLAAAAAAIHDDIELGNDIAGTVDRTKPDKDTVSALASLRRSTWVGTGILADKAPADRAPAVTVNVSGSSVQVVEDYRRRLASLESASSVPPAIGADSPVVDVVPVSPGRQDPAPNGHASAPAADQGAGGVGQSKPPSDDDGKE